MTAFNLVVNGNQHKLDNIDTTTPLLWVLRDRLGLVGSKFGCGGGYCGACTIHLQGKPVRSCIIPVSAVSGRSITTIEGLIDGDENLHPVQQAWIDHDVPQCGYCQAGQIMSAVALLNENPAPDNAAIDAAMQGNLCRCGTYLRIRRAIHSAAGKMSGKTAAV